MLCIWMVLWLHACVLSLCRVLSWLLVEEFVPEVVRRQGLMLNGSYPVWWGRPNLSWNLLGLIR